VAARIRTLALGFGAHDSVGIEPTAPTFLAEELSPAARHVTDT
jgi:hypothetical protein